MLDARFKEIIDRLCVRTLAEEVLWERTNIPTKFKVLLGQYGLTIQTSFIPDEDLRGYEYQIYDAKGERLEGFSVWMDGTDEQEYEKSEIIWHRARMVALNIGGALSAILIELGRNGPIGRTDVFEQLKKKRQEDDTPF